MSTILEGIRFPELVFGICGAIGVDIDQITLAVSHALQDVGYTSHNIKVTDELYAFKGDEPPKAGSQGYYENVTGKIEYSNSARQDANDPALLSRIAVRAISLKREQICDELELVGTDEDPPVPEKQAYIVHQIKRQEEVFLLREVYGKKFVLISAYASEEERKSLIAKKIKRNAHTLSSDHDIRCQADYLVERDADEGAPYGQRVREAFHLADLFIDGIQKKKMEDDVERFIQAFFGRNDIAPSKDEYGMYAAKSASLRSSDLSRQVGAAIFSDDGELITQGCNEVPKAFGGTYWDMEEPDFRDVRLGSDPNELLRREIIKDLFDRLKKADFLSEKANKIGTALQIAEAATAKASFKDGKEVASGPLSDALIMDLTEYGRIVHAEMCAICDAARLGRVLKGATLFCTTFPCHNCTKHVLATGIKRVVYMEPYPKSKAKELHENEIEIESTSSDKVSFVPFLGISPLRYRDIFQKGRRKGPDGQATRWHKGEPRPTIDLVVPLYPDVEKIAIAGLLTQSGPSTTEKPTSTAKP